ncbi:MAG: dihydrolipoamide acetyltransferase family protein [Hyphomicrobiaceae bacterium]
MKTFRLPDLGEGLQEAEIVAWHVAAGDRVVSDQPLVSVETSKAVVEIPAPWPGRLVALHGAVGDVIAVGAPLVDMETEGATSDAGAVVGTLPAAPPSRERPATAPGPTTRTADTPVKASPAVRRRAQELAVALDTLVGSGPAGAIMMADVEAAARATAVADGFQPLAGVRRAMAEAMTAAGGEIVPASVSEVAVVEHWPAGTDPTVRLIRAVIAGCRAAPELNAWYDASRKARSLRGPIDLGIAMETADGLFVPTLRNVGARSDDDLRAGLEAMKADVARRSIPLAELRGQTITLSNFGMLGGLHAALTIMPPQVAILGAGRLHRAARVIGDDIRAVRVLPLSLTFDHRVVTGAEAVRFLVAAVADLES